MKPKSIILKCPRKPKTGYVIVHRGKVQPKDYVCTINQKWEKAWGLVGESIKSIQSIKTGYILPWFVCRKVKK